MRGKIATALAAYFDGDIRAIDSLPIATEGTAFQKSVWHALRGIPAGQTISYGELARRLGKPAAVRADDHSVHLQIKGSEQP